MKQFILLTFAFLGVAFYELSGGDAYAPRPGFANSGATPAAPDIEVTRLALNDSMGLAAPADAQGGTDATSLRLETAVREALRSSLASPGAEGDVMPAAEMHRVRMRFPADITAAPARDVAGVPADDSPAAEPAPSRDLRAVAGDRVNLRNGPGREFDVLDTLARGTQVEVLEAPGDGWVMLQVVPEGRIGWMADWLLREESAT